MTNYKLEKLNAQITKFGAKWNGPPVFGKLGWRTKVNLICSCGNPWTPEIHNLYYYKKDVYTCSRGLHRKTEPIKFDALANDIIRRAINEGYSYDPTFLKDGRALKKFYHQDSRCYETDELITIEKEGRTASPDREYSSDGYFEHNLNWVHKDVNTSKQDLDPSVFRFLCMLVNFKQLNKMSVEQIEEAREKTLTIYNRLRMN